MPHSVLRWDRHTTILRNTRHVEPAGSIDGTDYRRVIRPTPADDLRARIEVMNTEMVVLRGELDASQEARRAAQDAAAALRQADAARRAQGRWAKAQGGVAGAVARHSGGWRSRLRNFCDSLQPSPDTRSVADIVYFTKAPNQRNRFSVEAG
jgi:hypothetical protein